MRRALGCSPLQFSRLKSLLRWVMVKKCYVSHDCKFVLLGACKLGNVHVIPPRRTPTDLLGALRRLHLLHQSIRELRWVLLWNFPVLQRRMDFNFRIRWVASLITTWWFMGNSYRISYYVFVCGACDLQRVDWLPRLRIWNSDSRSINAQHNYINIHFKGSKVASITLD